MQNSSLVSELANAEFSAVAAPVASTSVQPQNDSSHTTWITPDFVEIATCAELTAYVYTG